MNSRTSVCRSSGVRKCVKEPSPILLRVSNARGFQLRAPTPHHCRFQVCVWVVIAPLRLNPIRHVRVGNVGFVCSLSTRTGAAAILSIRETSSFTPPTSAIPRPSFGRREGERASRQGLAYALLLSPTAPALRTCTTSLTPPGTRLSGRS